MVARATSSTGLQSENNRPDKQRSSRPPESLTALHTQRSAQGPSLDEFVLDARHVAPLRRLVSEFRPQQIDALVVHLDVVPVLHQMVGHRPHQGTEFLGVGEVLFVVCRLEHEIRHVDNTHDAATRHAGVLLGPDSLVHFDEAGTIVDEHAVASTVFQVDAEIEGQSFRFFQRSLFASCCVLFCFHEFASFDRFVFYSPHQFLY